MSAEAELYAALVASGDLTALVDDRIWPDAIPEKKSLPAVVYIRASTNPITTISGKTVAEDVRFVLTVWAPTRTAAEPVADAIAAALAQAGSPIADRSSGFDPESGLFAVTVETDWWHTP